MLNGVSRAMIHFSIDDTYYILNDLAANADRWSTIFDHPHLHFLKSLHEQYGLTVSLYCFYQSHESNLTVVPDCYREDFVRNSEWLKWGFHARDNASRYHSTTSEQARRDYEDVMGELVRITGAVECLDRMPRLHFFTGNRESLCAMRDAKNGIWGVLAPDDGRNAYFLDEKLSRTIRDNGIYIDSDTELYFFPTDIRLEHIDNIAEVIPHMEHCLFDSKREKHLLVVFTHEVRLSEQSIRHKITDLCLFACEQGVTFGFLS